MSSLIVRNLAWIYLFIASCFEICWVYSVKYVSKDKIFHIQWKQFFMNTDGIITLFPLIGYVVFGIVNIYFFSKALNTIPASTGFAVWTGVALVGTRIVDAVFFNQPITWQQAFFFGCILVGIIGLKSNASA